MRFIPIGESDRLAVVARDPTVLTYARNLLLQIDRPDARERRYRFLYNVQHADPTQLQTLIGQAFAPRIAAGDSVADTDQMRITWDTVDGRVLIHATYEDYVDLMGVMAALDRPPQQVVLQTVIAEVQLVDRLSFGVEYFLESLDVDGLGTFELSGTPGLLPAQTGSAFFVGASGFAVLEALRSESSLNVIQQPTVTLVDGGIANFQVGGETPVQQSEEDTDTTVGGDSTVRRQIIYRDTGIILSLEPRVSESGDVRLKIDLENTAVGAETDLGPEFTTQKLVTEVVVPHGQTIVLAGFIENRRSEFDSKTPVLGDLPGLGLPFTSITDTDERSELFLTITPEIINNPNNASRTVSGFLEAADRMQLALSAKADQLPIAMLRDPDLLDAAPAVRLVLPPRPSDEPADAAPVESAAEQEFNTEPLPRDDHGGEDRSPRRDVDPLDELPEDTPEIIKQLLRSAEPSALLAPRIDGGWWRAPVGGDAAGWLYGFGRELPSELDATVVIDAPAAWANDGATAVPAVELWSVGR